MSWSASFEIDESQENDDDVVSKLTESNIVTAESAEQYKAALDAVAEVIGSDALGTETKRYQVTLTGHSNPNHEPVEGWANDFVSIQVLQV